MDAINGTAARRTRALALVAILLCLFAVVAPVLARQAGSRHPRINVVRVVNAAGADHAAGSTRLDQPLVGTPAVHQPPGTALDTRRVDSTGRGPDATTSTPSTRAPPVHG